MMAANFQDVMHNWKRMCKHYWNGDMDVDCSMECPLSRVWCPLVDIAIKDVSQIETDRLEPIVMAWAEDHPEPKYPTWYRWISDINGGAVVDHAFLLQSIPADIAEKYSIAPLEN